jgi:hypothetical protein
VASTLWWDVQFEPPMSGDVSFLRPMIDWV